MEENGPESILREVMAEEFAKVGKDNNLQIQESERTLNKIN